MSLELVELEVGSETYEGRLTVPEGEQTDRGVVMIPGAGHGPYGNIFDIVAYELAGVGQTVGRVETWDDHDELDTKTLGELHAEVDAVIAELQSRGCESIAVIAKSFGGGIALTYDNPAVDRLLLWAPAIEFGVDPEDALDPEDSLGESEDLLLSVSEVTMDIPTKVLVGDEDRGVSPEDCEAIVDAVSDGEVTVLPGENHSFNENRRRIVAETLDFLAPEQ